MIFREILAIDTQQGISFVNITERVRKIAEGCGITEGLCHLFLPATTAGLMLNENDRMLMEDFRHHFQSISEKKMYAHPDNAFSHLRASLLPSSHVIPVSNGKLILGTWQSIMLWEFDAGPRKRDIIVTVTGP